MGARPSLWKTEIKARRMGRSMVEGLDEAAKLVYSKPLLQ
jgi:hypothetical protein